MADGLKAALQSKLVTYESAGMTDLAKRVKARIAALEKPAKPAAVKAAAPAAVKTTARKTVKKAVKQTARKKK